MKNEDDQIDIGKPFEVNFHHKVKPSATEILMNRKTNKEHAQPKDKQKEVKKKKYYGVEKGEQLHTDLH